MLVRLVPPSFRNYSAAAASIREVVFGVEDGVVQNMTLIAGMVGAQLSSRVIVIAAAINAIAGVLSMSMGTYLSTKAERDVAVATEMPSPQAGHTPGRDALVMAGAYAMGAVVPIMPFLFSALIQSTAIAVAIGLTGAALFGLGFMTAVLSGQRRMLAGAEMLLLAAGAGFTGYFIGIAARAVFAVDF